jgi:hypothetical protein
MSDDAAILEGVSVGVPDNPISAGIAADRVAWQRFVESKPAGVAVHFVALRMMRAVGDKFSRQTMLFDIRNAMEGVEMARGKTNWKTSSKGGSWKDKLLHIPMDGYDGDDVRSHYGDAVSLMDGIDAVVQAGYKLSVSYNSANDNFIASLTGRLEGNPNFDLTISGFAVTWDMAVGVVLFKHYIICGEGPWAEHAAQRRYGDIG